ncbi:MAG: hypothetical protein K8W52_40870 [Deltaproteobacteria bacterium]|nr:hypothetical protein [Deltaproteobacteria bacterium]
MSPRLHVVLGGGGVGKTTLAAGYALGLAAGGQRVGLLGVDPSRQLQRTLGVQLADLDAPLPGATNLRAAIVQPHQAVARWVAEGAPDAAARLDRNPFFAALGDRLATATDVIAAARIAEWVEGDPGLTDLVVDTAPGVAAIDVVRAPRLLSALVEGRLIRWLRAAAAVGDGRFRNVRFGARRVLGGLASIAGAPMVLDLAEFFALVRAPLERMLGRVERTRHWLASGEADLLLVTSPRDTGGAAAREIDDALRAEGLAPRAVIVNRTWPPTVAAELATLVAPSGAEPFLAHARATLAAQAQVIAAVTTWAPALITLEAHPALTLARRRALAELGASLCRDLDPVATRSAS